jgi:hypothetical protein
MSKFTLVALFASVTACGTDGYSILALHAIGRNAHGVQIYNACFLSLLSLEPGMPVQVEGFVVKLMQRILTGEPAT